MKTESITDFATLSSVAGQTPAPVGFAPTVVDPEHVQQLVEKARRERSAAIRAVFGSIASGIAAAFADLRAQWKTYRYKARNRQALYNLDDRMLRDLGIDRGQIAGLVEQGVTGFQPDRSLFEVRSPANTLDKRYAA